MNFKDPKSMCQTIYVLFFVQVFMQFSYITLFAGFIMLFLGIALALQSKRYAENTIYESHIAWLIRTAWIGLLIYLPILTALSGAVILTQMDYQVMADRLLSGEITQPMQLVAMLMETNWPALFAGMLIFMPFVIWWLYRCTIGFMILRKNQPIENVMTWL